MTLAEHLVLQQSLAPTRLPQGPLVDWATPHRHWCKTGPEDPGTNGPLNIVVFTVYHSTIYLRSNIFDRFARGVRSTTTGTGERRPWKMIPPGSWLITKICAMSGIFLANPHPMKNSGWWLTYPSEKYEFVSWDDDIPNIWKNKKCSKPPTSIGLPILW